MSRFFSLTMVFIFILPVFVTAGDFSDKVAVYSDASPANAGRSLNRRKVTEVGLERFDKTESISAGFEGVGTPVIIDSRVKTAVEQLLGSREYALIENSVLTRNSDFGRDAYGFVWERYGFEIVFSFEKADDRIISEIEKVYGNNAWLHGELIRSYSDNYTVRVFKAENVFDTENSEIDFLEAMISATVIGSRFQPLLGIHDGLGVLDGLGLAVARSDVVENSEYIEYRKLEQNEDLIESFMHSVNIMEGDFVHNLYSTVNSITRKHSDDGRMLLPEQLFSERRGDNNDFVLFYYDLLKRNDYQVKFIIIDPGNGELYNTVFFREKGTDLWGIIDGNILEREKTVNWRRLPALVFSASVKYFEPDIEQVISSGNVILPPPSQWSSSLY